MEVDELDEVLVAAQRAHNLDLAEDALGIYEIGIAASLRGSLEGGVFAPLRQRDMRRRSALVVHLRVADLLDGDARARREVLGRGHDAVRTTADLLEELVPRRHVEG